MIRQSILHDMHVQQSARMTEQYGFLLPVHFGSITAEHLMVRRTAGMFDLSNICAVDLQGESVYEALRILLTNDVGKLQDSQGLYSCLCDRSGGVIDHLLLFRLRHGHFRLLVNSERQTEVIEWIQQQLSDELSVELSLRLRPDLCLLAVQGPQAVSLTRAALKSLGLDLPIDKLQTLSCLQSGHWFISRSGYTGEDGVELLVPVNQVIDVWKALNAQGISAVGSAARESLRIEAAICRYGAELDKAYTPAESGLSLCVDLEDESRDFIGRALVEDHCLFGGSSVIIGLALDLVNELRAGQEVERVGRQIGTITSATYSPVCAASIAMARVDQYFQGSCDIHRDGQWLSAHTLPLPFVPHRQTRE